MPTLSHRPSLAARTRDLLAGLSALCAVLGPVAALAGPDGGEVVAGEADIHYGDGDTRIDVHTDDAILRWDDFDIDTGERVEFVQPGEWSRVLNRVSDPGMTTIDGSLVANGQVFIVNPAGVFFGGNAVVETARLVAAAGHIRDDDFLSGRDHFELTGPVENRGWIRAGDVALLGASVANLGDVAVDDGSLLLVAGDQVWLTEHGSPVLIRVEGPEALDPAREGVRNDGTLDAGAGRVSLVAADHLGRAIQQRGRIRAAEIELAGGAGGRVAVSGTLDAAHASPRGGEITLTGEEIALVDARVDASGALGGGRIALGDGDDSRSVHVDAGSRLLADALLLGDGGAIVVDAADSTVIEGSLSARGGFGDGRGGFVETSGAYVRVDRAPELGAGGHWLIDPVDVTIVSSADPLPDPLPDLDEPPGSLFVAEVIAAVLETGADVTLTTEQEGSDQGNLRVEGAIVTNASEEGLTANLVLRAANDLEIVGSGAIANAAASTLTLNVELVADDDQTDRADPTTLTGRLSVGGAGIDASGGSGGLVELRGRDVTITQAVTTAGAGGIAIEADGGSVDVGSDGDLTAGQGIGIVVQAFADEAGAGGGIAIADDAGLGTSQGTNDDGDVIRGGGIFLLARGGDVSVGTGASITTDGGSFIASAASDGEDAQGSLDLQRAVDTGLADARGGTIQLEAPVIENDVALMSGGGDIGLDAATAIRNQATLDARHPDADVVGGRITLDSRGATFSSPVTGALLLDDETRDPEVSLLAGNLLSGGGTISLAGRAAVARESGVAASEVSVADGVTVDSAGGVIGINAGAASINGSDVTIAGTLRSGTGDVLVAARGRYPDDEPETPSGVPPEDGGEWLGGRLTLAATGRIETEGSDFVAAMGEDEEQAAEPGGAVDLRATAGDVVIEGDIDTDGGSVTVDATRSFGAFVDGERVIDADATSDGFGDVTPDRGGGRIAVTGSVDSAISSTLGPGDERVGGLVTFDADERAELREIATGGGALLVNLESSAGAPAGNEGPDFALADVTTAGGDVTARGQDGSLDGSIDLSGADGRGDLTAEATGSLDVARSADTDITADGVLLASGTDGTGDLALGNAAGGFQLDLDATSARLEAGDGFTSINPLDPDASIPQRSARVDFQSFTSSGLDELRLRQDADLALADVPEAGLDLSGVDVGLESTDGRVVVAAGDASRLDAAARLTLGARGQDSSEDVAPAGSEPFALATDLTVAEIALETQQHLVVDTALADRLSAGAPQEISITTGLGRSAADLSVEGDLVLDGSPTLRAERLILRSGAAGSGRLALDDALLAGDSISLRAGSTGTIARIDVGDVDGVGGAAFEAFADAGAAPGELRFHQEASVVDADLPELDRFGSGSTDGVAYTIRSESGSVSLGVDDATASKVDGTALELVTGGGDVSLLRSISVDSLAIRGLGDLQIEPETALRIGFEADGERSLELQSGVNRSGELQLDGAELAGDTIRLWGGNGVVLEGVSAGSSRIEFDDDTRFVDADRSGAPLTFVFQQEDVVRSDDLPDAGQFGPALAPALPEVYGIRSDSLAAGGTAVELTELPEVARLIVAGASVIVGNTDGEDLDFAPDGLDRELEFRADELTFRVTYQESDVEDADPDGFARLLGLDELADDELTLARFDADDVLDDEDFVFEGQRDVLEVDDTPALRPELFSFTQDAEIVSSSLPDPDRFQAAEADAPMQYIIQSDQGGIAFVDQAGYDAVEGVDLVLDVRSIGQDGDGDHDIDFAPVAGTLRVNSLLAETRGAFDVEDVTIEAAEVVTLIAASLPIAGAFDPVPTGQLGDLTFGDAVTLQAPSIQLAAGDGSTGIGFDGSPLELVVRDEDGLLLPGPVVDAGSLSLVFTAPPEGQDGPGLEIVQDGDLDQGLLPDGAAMSFPDAGAERLTVYRVTHRERERTLDIADVGAFLESPAVPDVAVAERFELVSETVALGSPDDLDFTALEALDTELSITAERLDFRAGDGVGNTAVVRFGDAPAADGVERLSLEGLVDGIDRIRVEQEAAITAANVPLSDQLDRPPVLYDLVSEGEIVLDDPEESAESLLDRLADTSVRLEAGGGVTLASDIERTEDDLEDLFVASDVTVAAGVGRIETPGSLLFAGSFALEGDDDDRLVLTAGNVAFYGSVQGGDGDETLLVQSADSVAFVDDVTSLESLEVHFGRDRVGGRFPTLEFGGLGAAAAAAMTAVEDGGLELGDAFAAPAVPAGGRDVEVVVGGDVRLDSNPGALDDDGNLSFPDDPRSRVPDVATIVQRNGNLRIASSGGELVVGGGEKWTVLGDPGAAPGASTGDLSLEDFARVTLADVTALGTLTVAADAVAARRREGGGVLLPDGDRTGDGGVDWVAREIVLTDRGGAPLAGVELVDSGRSLVVGLSDPFASLAFAERLPVFQTSLSRAELLQDDLVLDKVPDGFSRRDLSEAIVDSLPDPSVPVPSDTRPAHPERLTRVGIEARPATAEEARGALLGAAIYDDRGAVRTADLDASGVTLRVAEARLQPEAEVAARIHRELLGPDLERAGHIRRVLGEAVERYVAETGVRRVIGFELRRFLRNRPSSMFEAHRTLEALDALFEAHRSSGLARSEYRRIQLAWLEAIRPEGISQRELAELIYPTRYIRGSDVLDIFGQ